MGSESESTDLDRDVDAAMRMFEKSKVGPVAPIQPIKPARVMVVLDGSPQDETSLDAASHLRQRFNVETVILDARAKTDGEQTDLAVPAAEKVSGSRPLQRGEGESYDMILAALDQVAVDLVIVPCPFGRSFEKIGTDSAGTVIDVLLSRCPKPMLVIRRDDQRISQCVSEVSVVVSGECDVESQAAAWALGLVQPSGTVTLNLVTEKEQYENIRAIVDALHPESPIELEQFSEAMAKTHQSIHGAMAKTARTMKLSYHLQPQAGEEAPPNPLNASNKMLLVMPVEVDDRFTQGFVQDRIRRSPHPVLVVPGHVPH